MLPERVKLPAHLLHCLEELFGDTAHLCHALVVFVLVVLPLVVLALVVFVLVVLTLVVLTLVVFVLVVLTLVVLALVVLTLVVLTLVVLALVVLTLVVLTLVVLALVVLALVVLTLVVLTLVVLALVVLTLVVLALVVPALANPPLFALTHTTPVLFVLALAHPMLFTLAPKVPVLLVLTLSHDVLFVFADTSATLIMSMIVAIALFVIVLDAASISPRHPPRRSALVANHLEQLALAAFALWSIEFARGELLDHDDHPLMPLGCIRLCHTALEHSAIGSTFALRGNNGQRQAGGDEESGHVGDHDFVRGSWLVASGAVAARRFAPLRYGPTGSSIAPLPRLLTSFLSTTQRREESAGDSVDCRPSRAWFIHRDQESHRRC